MVTVGFRPAYVPPIVGCACSRTYLPSPEVEDEARRIAGLPPIDRSPRAAVVGEEPDPNSSSTHTLLTGGIIGFALIAYFLI